MKSCTVSRLNGGLYATLALLTLAATVPLSTAHAALPPGSYQKLQKGAPEFLHITVLSVHTKGIETGTEVTLTARVTQVHHSKTHLHKGAVIGIYYTSFGQWPAGYMPHGATVNGHRFLPHRVGPTVVPVLKKGKSYPAFLSPAPVVGKPKYKAYVPAAYGDSFEIL